jgi:nucleoside-diphosphate-sugar epimerase
VGDKYLVTGGAGFIGSNLVDELLRRGHEVRVIDNFSTGRRSNLDHLRGEIEVIEGDIRSYERVHNAVKGVDYVLHEAALPSVPRSVQDPLTTSDVNVTGTLNVLLTARDEGVERVIFASSSSVYGANPALPKVEGLEPMPVSPYGVAKLAGEQYCMAFFYVYGLETVALRYFNVFGPRQDPASEYSAVIPKFMRIVCAGQAPTVFGDGLQTRDFTHVSNVVQATCDAATREGVAGEIMNVAYGRSHTLLDLVKIMAAALGRDVAPVFAAARPGDVRDSYADVAKARELLGYDPRVSLEDGIHSIADEMLSATDVPGPTP